MSERGGRVVRLPTAYQPEQVERPVNRARLARALGVHPRTVDRWVREAGMPAGECWIMAGAQRRYFPTRVREWLAGVEDFGTGRN